MIEKALEIQKKENSIDNDCIAKLAKKLVRLVAEEMQKNIGFNNRQPEKD